MTKKAGINIKEQEKNIFQCVIDGVMADVWKIKDLVKKAESIMLRKFRIEF